MKTIAIVGAGFSGAVSAIQLLRHADRDLRVILINRSGPMGRGLAYGTASPDHLLNVPAGNMSALADEPGHFLAYCRRIDNATNAATFVARQRYGDYLAWLLDASERAVRPGVSLVRVTGEVVSVQRAAHGTLHVCCADGTCYVADRVLAPGHAPARDPVAGSPAFFSGDRYVRDPWQPGALDALGGNETVLLLGTGLTAVDLANRILRSAPGIGLVAMSRRGLLPQPHRQHGTTLPTSEVAAILHRAGLRSQFRALRERIADAAADGADWRDVIGALRSLTPEWWQALSGVDRRRFLRHVQPYWDAHRHRVAPAAHACFEQARKSGRLRTIAGRLISCSVEGGGVIVRYRRRGADDMSVLRVARIINCTGPEGDPRRMDNPLIQRLIADGLIQPDPLGLGLVVAADGALVDAAGDCASGLFYVGPLLKARDWEATAVPELRSFARGFARQTLACWELDGGEPQVSAA